MTEPAQPGAPLSRRELQVLHLLSHGDRNRDIAERFGIDEHSIKIHVGRILKKLGATNRAHAVRLGVETGILLPYTDPANLDLTAALAETIRIANPEPLYAALISLGWTPPDVASERAR